MIASRMILGAKDSSPIRSGSASGASLLLRSMLKNRYLYLMFLPGLLFYVLFHYWPMYGAIIAFKDFSPARGIFGSAWVGLQHFKEFFGGIFFWKLLRNTVLISLYGLVFGFPAPILLALSLNEVRMVRFKRAVQTASYLPHFISMVVVAGMMLDFLSPSTGIINRALGLFGIEPIFFMVKPEWFRSVYTTMNIWKGTGWSSIIFLSALSGIDPQLYEAAVVDGAGRVRQLLSITLPGIASTIMIMLILALGSILSVGFEAIILLYNPAVYDTADVIQTFVYRRGLIGADFSFATAVGLFQSVVTFALIVAANQISRKVTEASLW